MRTEPYPKVVIFIRHGESVGNIRTREEQVALARGTNWYGLTDRGREQARLTGNWMREHYPIPDRVIRSYYGRTNETAHLVYPDAQIREDVLLAERDRGIWTNATEEQVRAHMPWEIARRDEQGPYHYRPPGGENFPDVERRVREFRRSIRANYSDKTIVVVGHSHWILLWQKVIHDWSIDETIARFRGNQWVENASVLIYRNAWDPELTTFRLVHEPANDYFVPWQGKL